MVVDADADDVHGISLWLLLPLLQLLVLLLDHLFFFIIGSFFFIDSGHDQIARQGG